jgi:hypothetical protein
MQYTETELSDLIKSVEMEFAAHLAKSEPTDLLAKSEDAPEKEESEEKPKEESKEESHEEPKKEEGHEEEHKEEGDAPKFEGKEDAPEKEAAPESKEEGEAQPESHDEESHGYDDEDMEHMHKMYSSMKKGELKAHHDCIKGCLDAHKQEGMEMQKSEEIPAIEVPEVKNEQVELLKSELSTAQAEKEDLKKSLDMVTEILAKMVKKTVPSAKAVTTLDVIEKSEPVEKVQSLTKSEITAKLNVAASRPDLAKSDREAINAFYLSQTPNLESISHLLK